MTVELSRLLLEALNGPLRPWSGLRVRDVVVGRSLVFAMVDGGWCGVAYAPRTATIPGDWLLSVEVYPRMAARYAERSVIDRAVAIAVVNAISSAWIEFSPESVIAEPSLRDFVDCSGVVVILGYMKSLVEELSRAGCDVVVAEADPLLMDEARHRGFKVIEYGKEDVLAKASTVVMSGSGVVLWPQQVKQEFSIASRARFRLLVGPTASFHPLIALRLGATHVAGTHIRRELCGRVSRMVKLGYGFHEISRRAGRLVKFISPPNHA